MVAASGAKKGDLVLEIGPGMGVLTEALLATEANVVAIEKDDRLIPILEEKFKKEIASGRLKLVHGDVLEENFEIKNYKVVANIPYYITGQVIRKFLEEENQPESMTLLLQKEVAERIVARDRKESLLSLSVKAYGEPKLVGKVPRGAFQPAPNVDSAIVHIGNISKEKFTRLNLVTEKKFFDLIHAGFAHKRKQLLPNLSVLSSKDALLSAFQICNLNSKCRAEDVSIETWFKLCKILSD